MLSAFWVFMVSLAMAFAGGVLMVRRQGGRGILLAPFARAVATAPESPRT